jgi:hypothetical protein
MSAILKFKLNCLLLISFLELTTANNYFQEKERNKMNILDARDHKCCTQVTFFMAILNRKYTS